MACAGGTSRGGGYAASAALAPGRPGCCGSGRRQVHGGQGEASGPSQATLPAESPRSGAVPRQPPVAGARRACVGGLGVGRRKGGGQGGPGRVAGSEGAGGARTPSAARRPAAALGHCLPGVPVCVLEAPARRRRDRRSGEEPPGQQCARAEAARPGRPGLPKPGAPGGPPAPAPREPISRPARPWAPGLRTRPGPGCCSRTWPRRAPAGALRAPGRRRARPRAPRRMIFGKKVLMANLVFILKLLTMIFLG